MDDTQWQETALSMASSMYKVAAGILHTQADAQDAVQQTYLRVWERRGRIQPEKLKSYLMRTLMNECRNIQRHRARVTPVEALPLAIAPENESARPVIEAIADLPEHLRLALWLRYLEDFSEKEAAAALGIPTTTLRSRVHRARNILKKKTGWEVTL